MLRRFAVILTALVILASSAAGVDLSKECRLTVELHSGGAAISGAQVSVYEVAYMTAVGDGFSYTLTSGFAASGVDIAHIGTTSENLRIAKLLLSYAQTPTVAAVTDSYGRVSFSVPEPGLYLVSIGEINGYGAIESYLAAVPQLDADGQWTYSVTARPKTEPAPYNPPVNSPVPTPYNPPPSDKPNLPQTGVLNWPIPVMAGVGIALVAVGLSKRKRR